MKEKSRKTQISHDDVENALKKFVNEGGIILQLPEQDSRAHQMIGGDKHQNFESLANLVAR